MKSRAAGGRTRRPGAVPPARALCSLLSALLAAQLNAAELIVESRVVDVVPIMVTRSVPEQVGDCNPRRPDASDLVALLAWDLRAECRTELRKEQYVDGYRVSYEWQDRIFEQVLAERPGDTLTLRVRLD